MKVITKEEAKELKEGTVYVIYNPLTKQYKDEIASKKDIAHNKYCYNQLIFFIKENRK